MPMQNKEKTCLIEAKKFLDEARDVVGMNKGWMVGDLQLVPTGTMLGNIASQKFADCMQPTSKEKLAPRR